MQSLVCDMPWQKYQDTFYLFPLSDLHLGAAACDEKLLRAHIDLIKEMPNARWLGGGDYIEAIVRKDQKRAFEPIMAKWCHGKQDIVGAQRDYAIDLLAPIADKCIGLVEGNHEAAIHKHQERNVYGEIVKAIAEKAGKKPEELALGVNGFIRLAFHFMGEGGRGAAWPFIIYTHHGYGGGSLAGGHALALQRVLNQYECHIAIMGHRHVRQTIVQPYTKLLRTSVEQTTRIGLFVASYLNHHIKPSGGDMPIDTYAEMKGHTALPLGTTPIWLNPAKRSFGVMVTNETADLRYVVGKGEA